MRVLSALDVKCSQETSQEVTQPSEEGYGRQDLPQVPPGGGRREQGGRRKGGRGGKGAVDTWEGEEEGEDVREEGEGGRERRREECNMEREKRKEGEWEKREKENTDGTGCQDSEGAVHVEV